MADAWQVIESVSIDIPLPPADHVRTNIITVSRGDASALVVQSVYRERPSGPVKVSTEVVAGEEAGAEASKTKLGFVADDDDAEQDPNQSEAE